MFKNVAGQKLTVYVFDSSTGLPETGDAANLTAYVSKDDGTVTALTDTSAAEKDATNAAGYYTFDLSQSEVNADKLDFSGKSSTSGLVVVASPPTVYTRPANFSTFAIDGSGRVDVGKLGGDAQSLADLKDFADAGYDPSTNKVEGVKLADAATTVTNAPPLHADWVDGGRLDLLIDAIKAVTDLLNAAQSEPTGVPAANETPLAKLGRIYMMLRNKKTVTGSKKTYFDDGDSPEFEADLSDDGTTYTESELNSI